jgi:hypothetical protein
MMRSTDEVTDDMRTSLGTAFGLTSLTGAHQCAVVSGKLGLYKTTAHFDVTAPPADVEVDGDRFTAPSR